MNKNHAKPPEPGRLPALVAVGVFVLSGCSVSMNYSSGGAQTALAAGAPEANLVVVDMMDARHKGGPSLLPFVYENNRNEDIADLRRGVRTHAVNAGLVPEGAWFPATPKNGDEAKVLLVEAAGKGAKAVLFTRVDSVYVYGAPAVVYSLFYALTVIPFTSAVGLAPFLIVASLPINAEYASAEVSAFLADPHTGKLLTSFQTRFVLDDDGVTGWGFAPEAELPGVVFEAMEKLFGGVGEKLHKEHLAGEKDSNLTQRLFAPFAAKKH